MTDNEIIKALECCKSGTTGDCKCCPRLDGDRDLSTEDCMEKLMHDALALINRQKETIEQLQTALFKCGEEMVEVVRCKDCTEWNETEGECSHWYGFRENDFCSYGERKEQK